MAASSISASLQGGKATEKYLKAVVRKLGTGAVVKVGFFEDETYPGGPHHFSKAARKGMSPEAKRFADFLEGKPKFAGPVAQVALWNEFGTKRSPARPFMRYTVASKSPRWGLLLGAALKNHKYDVLAALDQVGDVMRGQMRESIQNWHDPPNSKLTRELKGRNSPLRDSGKLFQSVAYEVTTDGP